MQYRQDIVTRMLITRVELITISIVTIRSIWHNSAVDFFAFWKISTASLRILWRHLPTEVRNVWCVVKYIQSSSRRRKEHPNRSIIGDAILPQSATKVTKTCGSKFVYLLWRHLTPQRKMAIWVHNYSPSGAQKPQRCFGKFTFCMTFGAHKLVRSEPLMDYLYELWQLLSALYNDVWKNYIGAHPRSRS